MDLEGGLKQLLWDQRADALVWKVDLEPDRVGAPKKLKQLTYELRLGQLIPVGLYIEHELLADFARLAGEDEIPNAVFKHKRPRYYVFDIQRSPAASQ